MDWCMREIILLIELPAVLAQPIHPLKAPNLEAWPYYEFTFAYRRFNTVTASKSEGNTSGENYVLARKTLSFMEP